MNTVNVTALTFLRNVASKRSLVRFNTTFIMPHSKHSLLFIVNAVAAPVPAPEHMTTPHWEGSRALLLVDPLAPL